MSRFLRVRCSKCEAEKMVFGNSASVVRCASCGDIILYPTGGKADVRARILEVL